MFYSLGSLFSINGRACFRALPATPYLLSFSLALKLTAYQQIDKVTTEDELHGVLLEEDVIDALDEVGYRGVPQREKLESKDKILRFFFCLFFFFHILVHLRHLNSNQIEIRIHPQAYVNPFRET